MAFGAVVAIAFAGPAAAENFAGVYYGVNAGAFSAKTDTSHSLDKPKAGGPAGQPAAVASLNQSINDANVIGGGQAGYNWRFGPAALGVEADLNYLALSKSATTSAVPILNAQGNFKTFTTTDTVNASWVSTLRPRLGFVIADRSMVYVTAGLAFSNVRFSNETHANTTGSGALGGSSGVFQMNASKSMGKVYGAGYEWLWSDKMTVRLDYQHFDFGTASASGPFPGIGFNDLGGSTVSTTWKLKADVFRVGANWRF